MNIKAITTIFKKDNYITTDHQEDPEKEEQAAAPEVSTKTTENNKTGLFYNWRQETDTSSLFVPVWG